VEESLLAVKSSLAVEFLVLLSSIPLVGYLLVEPLVEPLESPLLNARLPPLASLLPLVASLPKAP
jgi:hypothetical protein